MYVYKYTKIMYLKKAIEYGLFASHIDDVNDPYEWEGIAYRDRYRICCVTSGYQAMLMWAYYVNHRECAIQFEINGEAEQLMRNVHYQEEFVSRREMSVSEIMESLFIKGKEWIHEREKRAVYYEPTAQECWKEHVGEIYLNASVKEVIFGVLAHKNTNYVETLEYLKQYNEQCDSDKSIIVNKMMISTSGQYKLIKNPQYDYKRDLEELRI